MAFAIEVTTPDIKGATKATVDKTKADAKADADKTKANVKGAADKTKSDVKVAAEKTKANAKAKIVDINSASEAELKAIPGIGDAYAAKIVAGRPYANKAQLKSRNILPVPVYEKTKDLIIATQPKK
jgi:DNA uptake protein ComE-like DNA-binding protein